MPTKITYLFLFLLFNIRAVAQSPQNDIQVNVNFYYFKGSEFKFTPRIWPYYLNYSRMIKDTPYFVGGSFSNFFARYLQHSLLDYRRGEVVNRSFLTFGVHVGYKFTMTPKRTFSAKAGLAFRSGNESQFYSWIQHAGWIEIFNSNYRYKDPGFEFSAQEQFKIWRRWWLNISVGYQYFIARNTTNHQFWGNAGGELSVLKLADKINNDDNG